MIKPAYSVSFLLSINIFVWQNVRYFLDAPRTSARIRISQWRVNVLPDSIQRRPFRGKSNLCCLLQESSVCGKVIFLTRRDMCLPLRFLLKTNNCTVIRSYQTHNTRYLGVSQSLLTYLLHGAELFLRS